MLRMFRLLQFLDTRFKKNPFSLNRIHLLPDVVQLFGCCVVRAILNHIENEIEQFCYTFHSKTFFDFEPILHFLLQDKTKQRKWKKY